MLTKALEKELYGDDAISGKHLFFIDLDGTLLANSATGEIHPLCLKAIKRARDQGHIVCLATGRPWMATRPVYERLRLNTLVANFNGAYIHNPADYDFIHKISYLDLNDVMYILGDQVLKVVQENVAIEGPGWVNIQKRDPDLEHIFSLGTAVKFREGLDLHKLPLKPTGVIVDINDKVAPYDLMIYLQRRYSDLAEFSWWSKGENLTPVFDITTVGVGKGQSLALAARYYGIPISHTIAIGDGFNDITMFRVAEYAVAMANAEPGVKKFANFVTERNNKTGGVGEFIDHFLDNYGKKNSDFLQNIRQKKRALQELSITPTHTGSGGGTDPL